MRPCNHKTVLVQGEYFQPGTCRICWLFFNDPKYRQQWADGEDINVEELDTSVKKKECNCNNAKKRDIRS